MSDEHADVGAAHESTGGPHTIELAAVAPESLARVERALSAAVRHHADTVLALRTAVEACAAELAARNLPPERVLIAMKGLVRHVASRTTAPEPSVHHWILDGFMNDIVRWTIGAYYKCDVDAAPVARRAGISLSARGTDAAMPESPRSRIDGR